MHRSTEEWPATVPFEPAEAAGSEHVTAELESQAHVLDGLKVAFVGKLGGVNRKQARDLVKRLGGQMVDAVSPDVDWIVIGADALPVNGSEELNDDWIDQAIGQQRLRILSETEFWQELGVVEPELDVSQLYTPAMLAGLLELPISTIRRWHRRGLIVPTRQVKKLPYFDYQEVASARRIASMIASGANPSTIERRLTRLAELYPHLQRPLTQLSVIVEGSRVLLRQGEGLVEPCGQMRIDFESIERHQDDLLHEPSSVLSFAEAAAVERVAETSGGYASILQMAVALEDDDDWHSAIEAYRLLLLAQGPRADVCFRLAELLYQDGQLEAARERYYVAVELDGDFVEARANLGCVLVELGELHLARSAFEGALEHHRDYPDVHFHMARLLDDLGELEQAEQHWARFLELMPRSPWADEARARLSDPSLP